MEMFTSVSKMSGLAWAADIMTGQKPFPTFNKERKGEGFKEILDKEMEKNNENQRDYIQQQKRL